MSDKYSFLVIKYPHADTARAALEALKELSHEKVLKLRDAAVVTKNEKGKIKVHQTKDDSIGKGFVKGGLIGVVFAALFGPVGWIAMGAAAGGLFASFDRGIKNKLLKELGENMTSAESAVAILVEHADWQTAVERMKAHGFGGQVVVSEIVAEDLEEVEKLLEDPATVASVPEELEIAAPVAAEAAAVAAVEEAEEPAAAEAPSPSRSHAHRGRRGDRPRLCREARGGGHQDDRRPARGRGQAVRPGEARRVHRDQPQAHPRVGRQGRSHARSGRRVAVQRPARGCGRRLAGRARPRNPANLAVTVQEVAAARPGIVRRVPGEAEIAGWIEAAGQLDKVVEH